MRRRRDARAMHRVKHFGGQDPGCLAHLGQPGQRGLQFLLSIGGEGIVTLPSIQSYLSFVTLTLLAFGVAFLFPVIVLFLNFVGIFPAARMRSWRRGMIVGIAIAAAVLTLAASIAPSRRATRIAPVAALAVE